MLARMIDNPWLISSGGDQWDRDQFGTKHATVQGRETRRVDTIFMTKVYAVQKQFVIRASPSETTVVVGTFGLDSKRASIVLFRLPKTMNLDNETNSNDLNVRRM